MEIKPEVETFAKIKVVGVGGSGGSAISRMMESGLQGVEFVAINTDSQALNQSPAKKKLHIGKTTTRGLGAGMDPEVGMKAAEESAEEIGKVLKGADMVFITCGLGGGTGSGASQVVADIARESGALTVAVVTKPFAFEGEPRRHISDSSLVSLQEKVDTIITIPNDRLLQIIDKKTSLLEAFKIVDEVLRQGVQGISDLIINPGLINVDFADVKSVMADAGSALMGIGKATGENRAVEAAKAAIDSPLLEMSIDGAKGILFTIAGDANLGMYEVNEAARVITETADPGARIIFGSVVDENLGDEVKVTVVATGFGTQTKKKKRKIEPVMQKPAEEVGESVFSKKTFDDKEDDMPPLPPRPKPRVEEPKAQPVTVVKPKPVVKPIEEPVKPKEADSDLDIPTFIRKKMM